MLHEVLISLWGCSTTLNEIVETDINDMQQYMHPAQRAIIVDILSVVKQCNNIRRFIKSYSMPNINFEFNEAEKYKFGLYIRALCNGMDEVLQPFRDEVNMLERMVLDNPNTSVTMIKYHVDQYAILFANLNSIIRMIKTQNLHGCKLLQCLHTRIHTGVPDVQVAIRKIMYHLHVVFYIQLTNWLLNSRLEDQYKEFFIQKVEEDVVDRDSSFFNDPANIDYKMWEYEIAADMLPSYIHRGLATKILTIGQTVLMFRNDSRLKKDFKKDMNKNSKGIELSIWGEKEKMYFQKLLSLQARPIFHVSDLEQVIHEMKLCVEEHLWVAIMEEAQLMQQLKLLKEFYLTSRGDLYLEFIKLGSDILKKVPTNRTTNEINLVFQKALRKTSFNDELSTGSFSFHVAVPTTENEVTDTMEPMEFSDKERKDPHEMKGWNLISLKYKVVWPLHLLFGPKVIQDYNVIFRFLLRVKKTQMELHNLWRNHMRLKEVDPRLLKLRHTLIFIIDNLQYYLQVDVLESEYTIMENKMNNTRNFEDVQKAHSVFLANVLSQMFLLETNSAKKRRHPVSKLLGILLRLCDDLIKASPMWEGSKLMEKQKKEIKVLSDTLESVKNWLTKTLEKLRAQSSGDHLARLLQKIDFNHWFNNNTLNSEIFV